MSMFLKELFGDKSASESQKGEALKCMFLGPLPAPLNQTLGVWSPGIYISQTRLVMFLPS